LQIWGFYAQLYQFTEMLSHFWELKNKPLQGFKNTKWLRHFVFWY
jgi:hypothetical protein